MKQIRGSVGSMIELCSDTISEDDVSKLDRKLRIINPEWTRRVRFGKWVGKTPKYISFVKREGGKVFAPRGAIEHIRELGDIELIDNRVTNFYKHLSNIKPRPYQEEASNRLVNKTQGVLRAGCGAGKTVMGLMAIEKCQQTALIVVHTHDLVDQWYERIKDLMGVEPIKFYGKNRDYGPITIATIQTLNKISADEEAELSEYFGAVIVDECHHIPAKSFMNVINKIPAKYRFGLTATPERDDGLTDVIYYSMGKEVFSVDQSELLDAGYLMTPRVVTVQTGFKPVADNYSDMIIDIMYDEARNDLIARIAKQEVVHGEIVLILSNRVEHCNIIHDKLTSLGITSFALTGRVKKSERPIVLDKFRKGEIKVLIATSLADEGLDITNLSRLILSSPGKSFGRTIQRIGRIMRVSPDKKKPILYDLVDNHGIAKRQYKGRIKAYRQIPGIQIEKGDLK